MRNKVEKGEPFTLRGITYTYSPVPPDAFIHCDKCIFWKTNKDKKGECSWAKYEHFLGYPICHLGGVYKRLK